MLIWCRKIRTVNDITPVWSIILIMKNNENNTFSNFMCPKRFSMLAFISNDQTRIFESLSYIRSETIEELNDIKNVTSRSND